MRSAKIYIVYWFRLCHFHQKLYHNWKFDDFFFSVFDKFFEWNVLKLRASKNVCTIIVTLQCNRKTKKTLEKHYNLYTDILFLNVTIPYQNKKYEKKKVDFATVMYLTNETKSIENVSAVGGSEPKINHKIEPTAEWKEKEKNVKKIYI